MNGISRGGRGATVRIGEKAKSVTNCYQMQAFVNEKSNPFVGELNLPVREHSPLSRKSL